MYNKDLNDQLKVLRDREVRPPFAEMARLVATAPSRTPPTIPLTAKFVGAMLVGGMVAAGAWVLSANHPIAEMPRISNLANVNSTQMTHEFHAPYGPVNSIFSHARSNKSNSINFTEPESSVLDDQQGSSVLHAANKDSSFLPIHSCKIIEQRASIQPVAVNAQPIPPISIPFPDQESNGSFFATGGGAISRQFNARFQQTSFSDAFLGVGYSLSPNASLRVLAGEEVFSAPSSTTTNSISFHDTAFNSYKNVIGEIQSTNIPTLTRVYWLGASYRYTMGDLSNVIRPFAEAMAGGSTDGFLTHQSLGAEFIGSNTINLDLLFEASELIPQNSSWLTKVGFSAAVSYCW
jgi:hypothetical protein